VDQEIASGIYLRLDEQLSEVWVKCVIIQNHVKENPGC
jgi:hypothetical protein